MAQTWPASLPVKFLVDGYEESPPDNAITQDMSVGPPKKRRRSTAGVRPIPGKMLMTSAQVATLDTFYDVTLASGVLTFELAHPRTGVTVEMQFVGPPKYTPAPKGGDWWIVSMPLQVMP